MQIYHVPLCLHAEQSHCNRLIIAENVFIVFLFFSSTILVVARMWIFHQKCVYVHVCVCIYDILLANILVSVINCA